MFKNNRLFALLAALTVLASNAWALGKGDSSFRARIGKTVKIRTVSRSDGSICGG